MAESNRPFLVSEGGRQDLRFYTDASDAFVSSFNVSSYPGGDMYNTGDTGPLATPLVLLI